MTSIITRTAFPTRPDELTAKWLTTTLQEALVITENDSISSWSTTDIGAGVGMMGEIVRLSLECSSGCQPLSVIAKFATRNDENRSVAAGFAMYEREVRFYRELAPRFPNVAPRCFFTDYNPVTNDMVLLFEDLVGYRPGDQTVGISLEDARLAILAVAQLHAATWGAQEISELGEWPRVNGPIYLQGFGNGVAAGLDPAMKNFGHVVPSEVLAAGERFRNAIPYLHEQMATGPQALVHGDFRVDNFMFGTSDDHRPFVMLDFQAPIVTKAVHDVAYLLTQSLPVELRREHERALVIDYHQALVDKGVTHYSAEDCWEDYRLAALHCFEFAVVVAGTIDSSNERAKEWIGENLRRSSQAIVDLGLLDLLP